MNHRTRNFMIGSAAVLVIGLAAGLVAYYGGLPGIAARHAGPQELEYLPADAAIVAYADVANVMRSDFRQRMQSVIPEEEKGKGRQEFEKATGIDVERDIEAVLAAVSPGAQHEFPIVAVRGTFDEGRIEAFAREHGAVVEVHQGVRVISMPHEIPVDESEVEPGQGREGDEGEAKSRARRRGQPALAFVEPGLLVVGSPNGVKAAVDRKRSGMNATGNSELMGRIARLEGNSNAWAVGRMDSLATGAELPSEVAANLPALTWFEAAGHVNGGINGTLRAEARDEESAKNLRDMLNGFMALGRMQAQSNPQVQALMQSVTLGGTGKTIELTFAVPAELIELVVPKARAKSIASR